MSGTTAVKTEKPLSEKYRLARDYVDRAINLLSLLDKQVGVLLEDEFVTYVSTPTDDDSGLEDAVIIFDDVFSIINSLRNHCSAQYIEQLKEEDTGALDSKKKLVSAIKSHNSFQRSSPDENINSSPKGPLKPLILQDRID